MRKLLALSALLALSLASPLPANGQQQQQQLPPQPQPQLIQVNSQDDQLAIPSNTPYYIQSPLTVNNEPQLQQPLGVGPETQMPVNDTTNTDSYSRRQLPFYSQKPPLGYNGIPPSSMRGLTHVSPSRSPPSSARNQSQPPGSLASGSQLNTIDTELPIARPAIVKPTGQVLPNLQQSSSQPQNECFYERKHFAKLDECLLKRPYPTVGLPAFKNEDLLIKRGVSERHGCVFVLNGGLFKNYQINKYQLDSESSCLDNSKVELSLGLSNTTLAYLWSLRCLNHASQLLDDATLDGKTVTLPGDTGAYGQQAKSHEQQHLGVCVGSSQNFGFTSIQLSNVEAQVELAMDIYKNWRVTNITLAMVQAQAPTTARSANAIFANLSSDGNATAIPEPSPILGTSIRDFVFESLDGDELNWRYLHLYQNWARNRMHTNFLDQYRRFLWISMQRCLSEASERLPIKLFDVFTNQRYSH